MQMSVHWLVGRSVVLVVNTLGSEEEEEDGMGDAAAPVAVEEDREDPIPLSLGQSRAAFRSPSFSV